MKKYLNKLWQPYVPLLLIRPYSSKLILLILILNFINSVNGKAQELVINGGFETTCTAASFTTYSFYTCSYSPWVISDHTNGIVTVAANAHAVQSGWSGTTHSGNNVLVCDGPWGGSSIIIWSQSVNVTAGQTYDFSAWYFNETYPPGTLHLIVESSDLATSIPYTQTWSKMCAQYTATSSGTISLKIVAESRTYAGGYAWTFNDFSIDDISFKPSPTICLDNRIFQDITSASIPFIVKVVSYIRAGSTIDPNLTQGPVIILNGDNRSFLAGKYISLEPGFKVENGAVFSAFINTDPCDEIVDAGPDISTCANCIELGTTPQPGFSYVWAADPDYALNYLSATNIANPQLCAPPGTYIFTVTVTNPNTCGISSDEMTFYKGLECGGRLGYLVNDDKSVISPNPTDGLININLSDIQGENISITIQDSYGRQVYSNLINSNKQTELGIDLLNQQSGLYFIRIKTDSKTINQKIVKL